MKHWTCLAEVSQLYLVLFFGNLPSIIFGHDVQICLNGVMTYIFSGNDCRYLTLSISVRTLRYNIIVAIMRRTL